ncbi:MAG: hypothetical protein QM804_07565 [Propionicimonas sp.]
MALATIMMLVILGIALAIIAIVAIGMQGNPRPTAPKKVRTAMVRTAKHLNGEAPPPPGLVTFLEDLKIRSARSASSGTENTGEQPRIS